jgi:alpha-tubulin suppressor-like RCC1 family protein
MPITLFSLFTCSSINDAENPYNVDKTRISLQLQSSTLKNINGKYVDTLAKLIQIGAEVYLPSNLDSAFVIVSSGLTGRDTVFTINKLNSSRLQDTTWFPYTFGDTGTTLIKGLAYIKNKTMVSDSIRITIVPTGNRNAPVLSVVGNATIVAGQLCSLNVTAYDGDANQTIEYSIARKPFGSTFEQPFFKWNTPTGFAGTDTVIFVARDNGIPPLSDTEKVAITVSKINDTLNHQPKLNISGKTTIKAGALCSLYVAATDVDVGQKLDFSALKKPSGSTFSAPYFKWTTPAGASRSDTLVFMVIDDGTPMLSDTQKVIIAVYDTTGPDVTGPVITQVSGPVSGEVVKDSVVSIIVSISDRSDVDSVRWSLNGAMAGWLTDLGDNRYSLKDTVSRFHLDTIVIYAQDESTSRNKSNLVIAFDYNTPPGINDTAVSMEKNTPLSWMLHCLSRDEDPLTWSALSAPSATSGVITGTLPNITFTPVAEWTGTDSFLIIAKDAKWSDTAKVKVIVYGEPIGPKNVAIVLQPATDTVLLGRSVTFIVTMNSDVSPLPTYQWERNGIPISTASSFTLSAATIADTGQYTVTVTNSVQSIKSPAIRLFVCVQPSIAKPQSSLTKCVGESALFSIEASGTQPLFYQWQKDGVAIAGSSHFAIYSIASVSASDSGVYTCFVTNNCCSGVGISSLPIALIVNTPPVISVQPVSQTKWTADSIIFKIKAWGTTPLNYQWKRGGNNIPGANSDTFLFPNINYSQDNSAIFSCVVTNDCGSDTSITATLKVNAIKAVAGGYWQSLILKTDSTLWVCGDNRFGQIGLGPTTEQSVPVQLMTNVSNIATGYGHSLILKTDGTLWVCGLNSLGQLGLGDKIDRLTPVQVTGVTNVASVVAGYYYSLILKADGTLLSCGDNFYGQLGTGDTVNQYTPTQVMTGVSKMSAGMYHSLIIKTDGTLWGCGYNGYGQLGLAQDRYLSPVQLMTNVSITAGGGFYSLILKTDGTLWACGYNRYGQLGVGDTIDRHSLIQVTAISNVSSLAAGDCLSLFLTANGTLLTCGKSAFGELGLRDIKRQLIPAQIMTGVSSVTAGEYHILAITAGGLLWACGFNHYGQLGDGTMIDQSTPVQVKF